MSFYRDFILFGVPTYLITLGVSLSMFGEEFAGIVWLIMAPLLTAGLIFLKDAVVRSLRGGSDE